MSFVAVAVGTAAAGLGANVVGAIKAGNAAKQMESAANSVPQYQRSTYPGQMLATAQNELNANNPFMAAQNRAILQAQANSNAVAQKASLDPTMLLKMTEAYNANANKAQQGMYQDFYAQRQQKLQQLAQAYAMNAQEDENVYNNTMTAFNSKQNLLNAAAQTRVGAWQNVGNGLLALSSTATKAYTGGVGGGSGASAPAASAPSTSYDFSNPNPAATFGTNYLKFGK